MKKMLLILTVLWVVSGCNGQVGQTDEEERASKVFQDGGASKAQGDEAARVLNGMLERDR